MIWKYFICHKESYTLDKAKDGGSTKTRRQRLIRHVCDAYVGFKLSKEGKYELAQFYEGHSHQLASPTKRQFLRSTKKMSIVHKNLLYTYGRASIGPSKTHDLIKGCVGGYENVGCTWSDLQNYLRDLKTSLKNSDAYVFIDNFNKKRELNPSCYFAYKWMLKINSNVFFGQMVLLEKMFIVWRCDFIWYYIHNK